MGNHSACRDRFVNRLRWWPKLALMGSALVVPVRAMAQFSMHRTACGNPAVWEHLIARHVARYPVMELPDLYKLLHQATMGSEHAVGDRAMFDDWMQRELAALGSGPAEPLVDSLGTSPRFVRVHLRPFIARHGNVDSLLSAFVATATTAAPDTAALQCALAAARQLARRGALTVDVQRHGPLFRRARGGRLRRSGPQCGLRTSVPTGVSRRRIGAPPPCALGNHVLGRYTRGRGSKFAVFRRWPSPGHWRMPDIDVTFARRRASPRQEIQRTHAPRSRSSADV